LYSLHLCSDNSVADPDRIRPLRTDWIRIHLSKCTW
jgi:hypothetical protein